MLLLLISSFSHKYPHLFTIHQLTDILIVSLFLAVINNPTMSASVQVFVWTYVLISWGIYLYIGLELLAMDTNLGKLWEVVGCILLSHEESDKTWQLNNMVTRYVTILGTSRLFSISDTQYSPSVKWSYKSSDAGFP